MSTTTTKAEKRALPGLATLQRIGRSLMLPIAVLPAAGILARFGSDDMLGPDGLGWDAVADVVGAAGNALLGALPLLFAVGVAIGFAKKSDGSTAVAAVVGYLVFKGVGDAMSPVVLGAAPDGEDQALIDWGVLGGILCGVIAALLWQRYYRIKLPDYLAFFGGRRFVPIVTALATLLLAVVMAFLYVPFDRVLSALGEAVAGNAVVGGFVFGTANRLLVPLGLHHILNSFPWFQLGEFTTADGTVVQGDIARFIGGDPTAGTFMTGFFPIMMFALPAAALAITRAARPSQRKLVGGIMLSAALTSFITGVTEPLEFAFMFVAFPLYVVHAVLTGTSLALVNALGVKDGFNFSAGLIDYLLNYGIATKPLLIIPIGLAYAVVYYLLFSFVIRRWNLRTPGREDDADSPVVEVTAADTAAAEGAGTNRVPPERDRS